MHDTVTLEKLGVPTVMVVTKEFKHEAYMQRVALGLATLTPAVIDHPLSTLSEEEIRGRARQAVPQVKSIWLSGASGESQSANAGGRAPSTD
jgi:hypothetical protein